MNIDKIMYLQDNPINKNCININYKNYSIDYIQSKLDEENKYFIYNIIQNIINSKIEERIFKYKVNTYNIFKFKKSMVYYLMEIIFSNGQFNYYAYENLVSYMCLDGEIIDIDEILKFLNERNIYFPEVKTDIDKYNNYSKIKLEYNILCISIYVYCLMKYTTQEEKKIIDGINLRSLINFKNLFITIYDNARNIKYMYLTKHSKYPPELINLIREYEC